VSVGSGPGTARRVNLAQAELTADTESPEGFRKSFARFGPGFGARDSGASLYELEPGQTLAPYHYEYGEEEWLLVLAGAPWLRTPAGTETLEPNDLAFFPCGEAGAHQVGNASEEPARFLMWSTIAFPTVCAYPDSGKVAIWDAERRLELTVERGSGVGYFYGEEAPAP
jgi:uncharacterized cupin superfamily protein